MDMKTTITKAEYRNFCRAEIQKYIAQGKYPMRALELLNERLEKEGWPLNKYSTIRNYCYVETPKIEIK